MSDAFELIKRDCGVFLCDKCKRKATWGMKRSNIITLCDKHSKEHFKKVGK